MTIKTHELRYRLPLLFLLLVLMVIGLVAAHPQLMAQELQPVPPAAESTNTLTMQRFLQDLQPPDTLAPLAATPCILGSAGSYPCENVDLMSFTPLATFGSTSGNDSWGWTDPLNGKEYALMGLRDGTGFVDITDPENPIYLGKLPTHTSNSSWRDIKVYKDYAFIVSEASGHGMQVFDLTRLRNVASPPVTFTEDAHYSGHGNAHNLVINEDSGYAYSVGTGTCSGGLHMINIQNPLAPVGAGCFSADGYTHDAQCVLYFGPDTAHVGKEICFNSNEDSVTVVDVTNKSAPVMLARKIYAGSAYTHQGWLTEDQRYFLVDDELDEQSFGHNTRTYLWDMADLDNPVLMTNYTAAVPSIDHNLYTVGNYAFAANYRSGLRILNISNIASGTVTEAGYFDIYPANNNASFNGAWSTYPYFDSGNIVISGIEQGLFIVRPTTLPPDFRVHAAATNFSICGNSSVTTTLTLPAVYGYSGSITLTTTTLPTGLVATFSDPASVPGTAQMTLTATNVASGSHVFAVIGSDGTTEHYETMQVKIAAAPPAPSLTSPANGATGVIQQPTFTWGAVSGATAYDLEVATDAAFTNVVLTETGLTGTSYTPTSNLDYETTYYWHVKTVGDCSSSAYSTTYSFTTEEAPITTQYLYLPLMRQP